jgi:Suppressor of fused protein (SUFU)
MSGLQQAAREQRPSRMKTSVANHLEMHLGLIQEGWSENADGVSLPFQVVRLNPMSGHDVDLFATLGLSNFKLRSRTSAKSIRCELVIMAHGRARALVGVLQQVATELIEAQWALLRGDVVGPRGPLVEGSLLEALYASIPVYFRKEFASCDTELGPVVFIWLIPISVEEAELVRRIGWPALEQKLEEKDPDLSDLFQPTIVSPTDLESGPQVMR